MSCDRWISFREVACYLSMIFRSKALPLSFVSFGLVPIQGSPNPPSSSGESEGIMTLKLNEKIS